MNPIHEIVLVMLRELRKNFRSMKGIVLFVLAMLGSGAFALLNAYVTRQEREFGKFTDEQRKEGFTVLLKQAYDGDTDIAAFLADAPPILYFVSVATVWFTPMLVAILGYDGISGEVQHRSVRFWTIRSRRSSYFLGKFFGLWITVSAVTLLMHVLVWTVATIGGVAPAGTILSWGLRFWLTSVPITCAWAGLATMVASLFRSPMIALLTVCGVFFVLFVVKLVGMATANAYVTYIYPNSLDALIMHPQIKRVMTGLGIAAGVALLSTLSGSVIFQKRDV